MKKYLIITLFLVMIPFLSASEGYTIDYDLQMTVTKLFNSLKEGDVNVLSSLLSESYLKHRQNLLKNPNYPDFLRNLYKDTEFKIVNVKSVSTNRVTVEIEIIKKGQKFSEAHFDFINHMGKWKLMRNKEK